MKWFKDRIAIFKRALLLSLVLGFLPNVFYAQIKKANRLYHHHEYAKAIPFLKKAYEETKEISFAEKLASSYWHIKNYEQAEVYYEMLTKQDSTISEEIALRYAEILKINNKREEAVIVYATFSDKKDGDFELQFNELALWEKQNPSFNIEQIDGINTKSAEFSPVKYKNDMVFVSDQMDDHVYELKHGWTGNPFLSIFIAEQGLDSLSYLKTKLFYNAFNHDYHTGPITFDSSYSVAIFTDVQNLHKGSEYLNRPQLYVSERKGKKWNTPYPFMYNSESYSLAHPALSKDGKMLVFTSDLPGGYGGKDLYVCYKIGDTWSKPQNLGPTINSDADEAFPFLYDKNTLYFASNGHNGYGGYDMFVSIKKADWNNPVNLKKPLNSSKDDFGLGFFGADWGYFSTNRKRSHSDDIYFFKSLKLLHENTFEISGVFMYSKLSPANNQKLLILDENDEVLSTTLTNEKGEFLFTNLEPDKNYSIKLANEDIRLTNEAIVYITNKNGERITKLSPNKKGVFSFKTLEADKVGDLAIMQLEDEEIRLSWLFGKAFKTLPGDLPEGLEVLLVDDEGNILLTTFLDENGQFKFENLPIDKNYKIRLKEYADVGQLILYNEHNEEIAKIIPDGKGGFKYELLANDQSTLSLLENTDMLLSLTTKVRGLLRLPNLDPDKISIKLLDGEDNIIETVQIEKDGTFEFNQLNMYKDYVLVVNSKDPGIDVSLAELFILNDKGEPVQRLNKDFNYFSFFTLSRDEYNLLPQIAEDDTEYLGINGKVYEYLPGDVPAGMEVLLLDDEGNIIETATIDRFGNFQFKTLPSESNYIIKIANQDNTNLKLFILDEGGNQHQVQKNARGAFAYKTLNREEARLLQLLSTEASNVTVLFDYHNPNPKTFTLSLLDENKNFIKEITLLNDQKTYRLRDLEPYKNYFIVVNTNDSSLLGANINMYVLNGDRKMVMKLTKDDIHLYSFYTLSSYEYEMLPLLDEGDQTFSGVVYSKLNHDTPEGLKIFLLDDQGNIIDSTFTDKLGQFDFKKLPKDKSYLIQIEGSTDTDLELFVFNEDGKRESIINRGNNTYKNAFFEQLRGKVLSTLPRDTQSKIKVFLLDDAGNIIDSTYASKFGDFEFNRLPGHKNYLVQIEGIDNSNVEMFIFDDEGTLQKVEYDNSTLAYAKPSKEKFYDKHFKGKVYNQLPGDLPEGLKVFMLDDNGNILDSAVVDMFGNFEFKKLPRDNNYKLFVKTNSDIELTFIAIDEDGSERELDENQTFSYQELARSNNLLSLIQTEDETTFFIPNDIKTVYYGKIFHPYDRDVFTDESKKFVANIVEVLNNNPEFSIKIVSHTDSKGAETYNQLLSTERALFVKNYFIKQGVNSSRIYYDALGEKLPASTNNMPDGGDNPYGRAINRRSEIFLIRK